MKPGVTWEQGVPPAALFNKELISLPHTTMGRKRDSRLTARPSELAEGTKSDQHTQKSDCREGNSSGETQVSTAEVQLIIQKKHYQRCMRAAPQISPVSLQMNNPGYSFGKA